MKTLEKPETVRPIEENSAAESLITLQNVIKTYTTPAGSFKALRGINLQIKKGEFMAVVGKSGSGKSTLLNMLTGIDRPTSGDVIAGQTAIHQLNEGETARWRGLNVGIVFQFFQLLPTLTIVENIMLAMDFCKTIPVRERKPRALSLLDQIGIVEQAYKLPAMLSGGQQQRVALARALANDPPILVADEPTGNLDTETARDVFQLLQAQAAVGKTVIVVTHDLDLAAQVNRTVSIVDGCVVKES
ncbi:MAG: ABC transporter ATP-binding protein [Anaerolineales bacterium]|nr:ABC transporter ATP-binding protein [Anaerolineales bacterium]